MCFGIDCCSVYVCSAGDVVAIWQSYDRKLEDDVGGPLAVRNSMKHVAHVWNFGAIEREVDYKDRSSSMGILVEIPTQLSSMYLQLATVQITVRAPG